MDARGNFFELFGTSGDVREVIAPGRVNLIGEHTDYNDGFVLPMAIDRFTRIVFRRRDDGAVRIFSITANEMAEFSVGGEVEKGKGWSNYCRGVAEALRQRGIVARGMDAVVESNVPIGGGLSSSASLEIAVGLALLTANNTTIDLTELALAGQWGENFYAGMPCGIMDPFVCAIGKAGHAMLLDCRDRSVRHVKLDDPKVRVVVVNTNVKHELVGSYYALRRRQCEQAVEIISRAWPEVWRLRDVTMEMLKKAQGLSGELLRRARHVVSENLRVVEFAAAMEKRDYERCGKLMRESHASLRDDYQVSCDELDMLFEIGYGFDGVYGVRMTGGGFGGCVVALCDAEAVGRFETRVASEYRRVAGREATFFSTVASDGAVVIK